MLRTGLSIVAGLFVAFVIVFACDAAFHALSSAPAPTDPTNAEAMRSYLAGLPPLTLGVLVVGWALAALGGAATASRLARRSPWPGRAVTVLFLLLTILNFAMVPHPTWMVIAGVVLTAAGGWLGARLGAQGTAARVTADA